MPCRKNFDQIRLKLRNSVIEIYDENLQMDKFFLNKISSFYGIREHKINKVEPQETRIFNLTYLNPIHNSTLGSIESNNPKLSSKTQFKMDFQSRNINNFHSNSVKKISFLNSKN